MKLDGKHSVSCIRGVFRALRSEVMLELVPFVAVANIALAWFKSSQHLSITQLLAHFPSRRMGGRNWKGKNEETHGLR